MTLSDHLSHDFAEHLPQLRQPTIGESFPNARVIATNDDLAAELGLSPSDLAQASELCGRPGDALGYAGHQFGGFTPQLGDGRAMLLGEVDTGGTSNPADLRDLHLKGSGRTPYSRPGSDGKLPLGAALREMVISEFLHAVGVPTSRVLAVIDTGEKLSLPRNKAGDPCPQGAVMVRVARHHIRVGTFQYAAMHGPDVVRDLVHYSLRRGGIPGEDQPAVQLFRTVVARQADLVARWMRFGFVHGVLNTDNVSVAGESIDFGPCAFLDRYNPDAVFSSIDAHGRYSFASQPTITQWNLARFAESLLAAWDDDTEDGVAQLSEELQRFPQLYNDAYATQMVDALGPEWHTTIGMFGPTTDYAARMHELNPKNPVIIPRNEPVQAALTAAEDGDLSPFRRVLAALQSPYSLEHAETDLAHAPEMHGEAGFTSYCGT